MAGNQECEDRGLLDKKDEGRQDDEMMQNQGTRPNPNPAQKAGFVYKVKEKLPGCQIQTQTGQTQFGNSQTQTQNQTQTQTAQWKTGDRGLFDKKDEGRQDGEKMQNQATRPNPNPARKAVFVVKVKECQTQTQTGQTQIGKAQTQTQTQTQTQAA
uniref:Uncharacterized protein n=1 Tax=Picea sitchensis TaxID=3332 RepID=A9P1A8_PICSI|nr:unknown [Picea sitchensis]